jgi:hypothetical protein
MSPCVDDLKQMDGATSIAVCEAIGENLRRTVTIDPAALPLRLQNLVNEMRRRENDVVGRPG